MNSSRQHASTARIRVKKRKMQSLKKRWRYAIRVSLLLAAIVSLVYFSAASAQRSYDEVAASSGATSVQSKEAMRQ